MFLSAALEHLTARCGRGRVPVAPPVTIMKEPDLCSSRKEAEQTVNCFMEWLRIHEFKMYFSQL